MMTHPDVVYVVRPGDKNEELRYSLRSLSNLPHGRVWIAGFRPSWVSGVEHIPVKAIPGGHQHAKANLKAACEHPEVSESFMYFNDDFFVMQPFERLPVMHRGSLENAIKTAKMATGYTRAMNLTLAILLKHGIDEPMMYDLHAPMTVTKAGMLEALALCRDERGQRAVMVQERTLFGNLQGVGGVKAHNHKVHRQDRDWVKWPFLSTNDPNFRLQPVGEFIRSRFPDQSAYEATPPKAIPTPTVRAPRTPVRYHAPPSIRRHATSTIRRVRVA